MGSKQQGRFVAFSLGFRLVVISGLAGAIEPGSFRAGTRAWKARASTVVQAFAFSKLEQRYAGEGARATGGTADCLRAGGPGLSGGDAGPIEIESQWTARKRERDGIPSTLLRAGFSYGAGAATGRKSPPKRSLNGAPPRVVGYFHVDRTIASINLLLEDLQ